MTTGPISSVLAFEDLRMKLRSGRAKSGTPMSGHCVYWYCAIVRSMLRPLWQPCMPHMKCCWNASWTVSGHRKVFCSLLAEAAPFWCRCSSKSRFSGCNGPELCCSSESPGNSRRPAACLWASTGHTSSREACQKRQNTSVAHVKQQQNADISEDVNRKLTLPFSTSLVIMMITPTFCSQIIRQKSSVLDFRGPWAAM